MDFLPRNPKISLSISKIAGVLVGAVAAGTLASFAVPYIVAVLSSAVPRLWSSVRFFLVPPYLFITVHLIIVAIWKLSDQKIHRDADGKPSEALKVTDSNVTPLKNVPAEFPVESDAGTPISESKSAESCVTTDSDENSAVSSRFEPLESKESEDEGMDLEDTWQTVVMKKSATWERSSEMAAVAAEVAAERAVRRSATFKESVEAAVDGNDELNRRFEEFIKKNYDQIRSY